ncbi:MAG: hypothetical protein ACXU7Z_05450 [Burkholderiaceae bacterium]
MTLYRVLFGCEFGLKREGGKATQAPSLNRDLNWIELSKLCRGGFCEMDCNGAMAVACTFLGCAVRLKIGCEDAATQQLITL